MMKAAYMFGWLIVIALATLGALEIGRYLRAKRGLDDFPYPRRRLNRRLIISADFAMIMIIVMYLPARTSPGLLLFLMLTLLVGILVGFALLWRDLRETSQAAVDHATALSRQTGESLKMIFENKNKKGNNTRAE